MCLSRRTSWVRYCCLEACLALCEAEERRLVLVPHARSRIPMHVVALYCTYVLLYTGAPFACSHMAQTKLDMFPLIAIQLCPVIQYPILRTTPTCTRG
jgi:hypothetical protein